MRLSIVVLLIAAPCLFVGPPSAPPEEEEERGKENAYAMNIESRSMIGSDVA